MCRIIFLLVFAETLFSGCAFTPRQLNAHPERYEGITVVLRGVVKLTAKAHVVCESRVPGGDFQQRKEPTGRSIEVNPYESYCVTIANPEFMFANLATFNTKRLTVQGRFVAHYQIGKTVDSDASPFLTAIIIDNAALRRRYQLLATSPRF